MSSHLSARRLSDADVSRCVAGLISLLQDSDPEIQSYAIEELDKVVGMYWAEISDHVVEM